ncbi:hypothetical protein YC2023_047027 [Brassica napus]
MITEKMAEELVEMFKRQVILKRLLVMELVSLSCQVPQPIYLTTWLAEINIDTHRMDEILATVGEEIRLTF